MSTKTTNNIHELVSNGDLEGLKHLLKPKKGPKPFHHQSGKVDINAKGPTNEQTPLHIAAYAGDFQMTYYLLSKGANVHAKDAQGNPQDILSQVGHHYTPQLRICIWMFVICYSLAAPTPTL